MISHVLLLQLCGGGGSKSIELECGQLEHVSDINNELLLFKPSITNIQNLNLPSGNIWTKCLTHIFDGTTNVFPLFSIYNFTENVETIKPKNRCGLINIHDRTNMREILKEYHIPSRKEIEELLTKVDVVYEYKNEYTLGRVTIKEKNSNNIIEVIDGVENFASNFGILTSDFNESGDSIYVYDNGKSRLVNTSYHDNFTGDRIDMSEIVSIMLVKN